MRNGRYPWVYVLWDGEVWRLSLTAYRRVLRRMQQARPLHLHAEGKKCGKAVNLNPGTPEKAYELYGLSVLFDEREKRP